MTRHDRAGNRRSAIDEVVDARCPSIEFSQAIRSSLRCDTRVSAGRAWRPRIVNPNRTGSGFADSLLLTDFYELSMLEAYTAYAMAETAVFELFVRRLPRERGFLMAAGLAQLVDFLERLCFSADELAWLETRGTLSRGCIERLATLRFDGDVDAMPEGTVFFVDEPIVRVTAALPVAQLVEARLLNLIHFQTVIASKAARMVLAAPGRQLVDFGLRRAHGAEAGLLAARASYLAGFDATATVLAGRIFGMPIVGTMAHSFIEAHDDERAAFERFARVRPKSLTLLIDTYDTERAAAIVADLAPRLAAEGIAVHAVRLDSGDLARHAQRVRAILDAAGQHDIRIVASGGLDEYRLAELCATGAPIDSFGIGTRLTTAADAPALDCAYKLQAYAGQPRCKLSEGKANWPGAKQVYRRYAADGTIAGDQLVLADDDVAGEPLLQPIMRAGKRTAAVDDLAAARRRAADNLVRLPEALRRLQAGASVTVEIDQRLQALAAELKAQHG